MTETDAAPFPRLRLGILLWSAGTLGAVAVTERRTGSGVEISATSANAGGGRDCGHVSTTTSVASQATGNSSRSN